MPMRPLLSTASAMQAHAASIHGRRGAPGAACRDSRYASTAIDRKALTLMSSELADDITTKYGLASSARAPNRPARAPNSRRPAYHVAATASRPVNPVHRRAVHSDTPKAR